MQLQPHDAADLHREIAAGPVQAFRKHKDTGETVLVCLTCGGLWNHKATDRLIERICAASKSADDPTSAGVQR